ncbi:imelysin family protein [Psychrobacter sp. I-STPA10]|uniref:imelysin family protein n=1 Tax=Psychrobacter sp. I-STPA10 TaxID=2585769 RepID=UPI001E602B49|nr:imelysin family protein [Psychrobacter sp. I-STPA10]
MKKHQLAAMVLSALSAGFLISCAKTNDTQTNEETSTSSQEGDTTTSVENAVIETTTAQDASATRPEAVTLQPEALQSYLQHVVDQQIIPAYAQATKQSQALHKIATEQCQQAPLQGDKLQQLREQWLLLAQAWATAEMINFGPATDSMTDLYINYYPDERGLVHQGVIDLIAANPKLQEDALLHESAIVQGIPGLEEVLYANDTLDAAQCNYIIGASAALTTRLKAIEDNWRDNGTQLLNAGSDADTKAGLNRWINSLLSLVETTKSTALDKPLGLTGSKKGHLPAAAAGQSRAIMTAKVAALNTALTDPVLTAMLAQQEQNNPVGEELSTELSKTTTLLAQMPENIADADKATQQQLYDDLTKITQLIKRQLIPTLGIQVGFNSTDGD